ncbi:paraquat-inducible protein A [Acidithiobacillus thiooxidans]|nr:paraquat-inducible protein A [Acidithiobacillus thiooxidans]MDR7926277.1 paraquat-inducible protein A [Acidithiobacillus thiooxidans]MDX5936298.1 paraquat-inducible protein A [Acidithiobacillus thiooxidans]
MSLDTTLIGVPDAALDPPHGVEVCPDCGLIQRLPLLQGRGKLACPRCGHIMERTSGRSINAAMAMTLSALFLLIPANFLPLLSVDIFGVHHQSVLASGIWGVAAQGWPVVAVILALELLILPFLRFSTLAVVLLQLDTGHYPSWLGRMFRWSEWLDQWAMLDVFLIGFGIGYERVAPFLPIEVGTGGWCVVGLAFLSMLTRATLERREIWRRIGPNVESLDLDQEYIGCGHCGMPVAAHQEGQACPRCAAKVWRYKPQSTMRTMAFALAGFFCYPFAYLYPMEYNYQIGKMEGYTIMTGVMKLIDAHFLLFAAIIFMASIVIPFLKLFSLSWFFISVRIHSVKQLRLKTAIYRLIKTIGRWSHVDVFTVTVFLPLMHLSGLLAVYVGDALPAFLAVVVLTMIATEFFDPRALWAAYLMEPHE